MRPAIAYAVVVSAPSSAAICSTDLISMAADLGYSITGTLKICQEPKCAPQGLVWAARELFVARAVEGFQRLRALHLSICHHVAYRTVTMEPRS